MLNIRFPQKIHVQIGFTGLIHIISLVFIFSLAVIVRILPLQWGAYLGEFDPYWHYYVAEHIVKHGVGWIFNDGWIDTRTWFPFGRHVAATTPMGLPLTAVTFYYILKSLGFQVSLLDVAIYLPPFMGGVTALTLYLLGKDFGGRETGILAGLLLALNTAYISRTTLGFFKHESIGVFAIVLISFLFLRSINPTRTFKQCVFYAVMAGLALAYLNISWGAFYYMLGLIPLYVLVAILLRQYTPRLLVSYFITMGISTILAMPFPKPGLAPLTTVGGYPALAGFILLTIYELLRHVRIFRLGFLSVVVCVVIVAVGSIILYQTGLLSPIAGKFIAVVNPYFRKASPAQVIVESVAEHRMSTWASFYYGFGSLIFLVLLGIYYAFKRGKPMDVFFILFGITALYATASYVRVNLILAPVFCLFAAYGFVRVVKPMLSSVKTLFFPVKKKILTGLDPKLGLVFIFIFILVLIPTFMVAVDSASTPVTIASASVPIREYREDWFDALRWINQNIPKGTPVICWWDYGYWVAIGGNSTTVSDNAALNTTQIAKVGMILLSNETAAFNVSREYFNSDYILVFVTTFPIHGRHQPWGYGDEGKWIWMARIAHAYYPWISPTTVDKDKNGLPDENTLLGKLILYACGIPVKFENCKVVYVSPSHDYVVYGEQKITTQVIIVKGTS
ncbi:hypothetical protein DRO26_04035 [Candidatus Bathyarchaeota archaeon]|nr:MAG: hypothetical protein DRO26_04035 [Candidatus Bathyarchaeota archaeon]